MTPAQRFGTGIGQGAQNTWLNVKDIAGRVPGLSGIRPSGEEWEEFHAASNPLLATKGGKVGSFAGETLATAPIGLGSAALAKQAGKGLVKAGAPKLARLVGGKLAQTMAAGAHEGAVLAGPENRGVGYLGGGLAAGAFHGAGRALRNLYAGYVKPTRYAQYLMRNGVEDMTLGRMNPNSALGQLEEASTSFPIIGASVKEARALSPQSWQRAQVGRTVPAGEDVPLFRSDDVNDMMGRVYESFNRAWSKFKGNPVRPVIETSVLSQIAGTPVGYQGRQVMLGSGIQQMVQASAPELGLHPRSRQVRDILMQFQAFSRNTGARQVSGRAAAAGAQQWPGVPVMDSEDLIELASKVRTARRAVTRADPYFQAKRGMWRRIENALDSVLERDLPNGTALADLRRKYAEWHVLNRATAAAQGRPEGFSPREVIASYRKGLGDAGTTLKSGGKGQRMAFAARQVFEPRVAMTGARYLMTIPGGLLSPMVMSPTFAKAVSGRTRPQQALLAAERAMTRKLGVQGRRLGSRAGQAFFAGLGANQVSSSRRQRENEEAREVIRRARERAGY
jgi:hypothetical protein